jgi:hypothetical protein
MLYARGFAREEILKQHRLIFCPNAAGTAKIRYTRFGANARAGEKNY